MDLKVILIVVIFAAVECTIRNPSDRCPEVRICTADYSPVCGSDGITYSNQCNFEGAKCRNQQLTKAYTGACRNTDPGRRRQRPSRRGRACSGARPCPMNESPVCGTDGKTYSNMCSLRAERCKNRTLRRAHRGACSQESGCSQICTREYNPVCGSDGKTYASECTMKAQNCRRRSGVPVRINHRGTCN